MNTAPKKNTVTFIIIVGVIIFAAVMVKAYLMQMTGQKLVPPTEPIGVACTMEAKICPDGSSVGRGGPNCEFAQCPTTQSTVSPTVDTSSWKSHEVTDAQLTFLAPPEMEVSSETQRNEKGEPTSLTLYIQKGTGGMKTYYQLYGLYQFGTPFTADTLTVRKEELQEGSVETSVSGYPALDGQIKGQRNRFVTYVLTEKGLFSLFTAEPTEENHKLTDQILSTFQFTK